MKITKEQFKNIVREVLQEESEYQAFFKKALEKAGKSIPDMSDEEKKAFFNKIDSAWQGKGEKKNEGNAFGAAVADAKEKGEDEFEVDGKEYKVESVNEATLEKGTKLRFDKNTFVVDYVVDKKYIGHDGFTKYILKVVKSNYPKKIKVGSTEEYEDARLKGLIRNRVMSFVKNESVNESIVTEATDIYLKGRIQITKFAGPDGLMVQINAPKYKTAGDHIVMTKDDFMQMLKNSPKLLNQLKG